MIFGFTLGHSARQAEKMTALKGREAQKGTLRSHILILTRTLTSKQSAFTISICLQLMKIYFKNLNNFIEERREFYAYQRGHGMDFKRIKKFWFKPLRLGTLRDSAQPPGKYSSKILASFLTSCLFMSVLKSLALREGFIFLVCLHQFSLIKP